MSEKEEVPVGNDGLQNLSTNLQGKKQSEAELFYCEIDQPKKVGNSGERNRYYFPLSARIIVQGIASVLIGACITYFILWVYIRIYAYSMNVNLSYLSNDYGLGFELFFLAVFVFPFATILTILALNRILKIFRGCK